jgi:hypothetical protein
MPLPLLHHGQLDIEMEVYMYLFIYFFDISTLGKGEGGFELMTSLH